MDSNWAKQFSVKGHQAGFSLVELMLIIAVLGILATLSTQYMNTYRRNAYQVEVKNNLRVMYGLVRAYRIENDAPPPVPCTTNCYNVVTDPNDDPPNKPNDFGWHLENAENSRYRYFYNTADTITSPNIPGETEKWAVYAISTRDFDGCVRWADRHWINQTGRYCHYAEAKAGAACRTDTPGCFPGDEYGCRPTSCSIGFD